MKKSEFKRLFTRCYGSSLSAHYAARLAEEAGATWDPELPERVWPRRWSRIPILLEEGRETIHLTPKDYDTADGVVSEAAARYNAMTRLLRPWATWDSGGIQNVLKEEREKLTAPCDGESS